MEKGIKFGNQVREAERKESMTDERKHIVMTVLSLCEDAGLLTT